MKSFGFLLILAVGAYSQQSCKERCGKYIRSKPCQCNVGCLKFGDCCADYHDTCFSCQGRCEETPYLKAKPCQCNCKCSRYGNCCSDYATLCRGIQGCSPQKSSPVTPTPEPIEPVIEPDTISTVSRPGSSLSTNDLRQETEVLFRLDTGGIGIPVETQGKSSSSNTQDKAPKPLIGAVPKAALDWKTSQLMQQLLDNYEADASVREIKNSDEQREEDLFLNALVETNVMKELGRYLTEKGYLSGTLRAKLKEIWFTTYKRSGRNLGSSGFEHVFVGELKGGKVSGFHNWMNFKKEEEEGDLNYKGYMKIIDLDGKGKIIKLRFAWLNQEKPTGSIFVGTTPETEFALYTLCFLVRPNSHCPVQLANHKFSIQTWTYKASGKVVIGSAYPNI